MQENFLRFNKKAAKPRFWRNFTLGCKLQDDEAGKMETLQNFSTSFNRAIFSPS
jgi:hypothetical protein